MPVPAHVRVPSQLLYDERVTPRGRVLWGVLDDVCREQRSCELSAGELAGLLEIQPRQLRTVTQELCDAGWLHVLIQPGRGNNNRYTPLGRVRQDLVGSLDDARDPGRENRQSTAPLFAVKAAAVRRLHARGTHLYARRKEAQGQLEFGRDATDGSASRPPGRWKPPHCGSAECDPTTRLVGFYDSDAPHKCPACHPSIAAPF